MMIHTVAGPRTQLVVTAAKKGGGKKGGGNKKQAKASAIPKSSPKPYLSATVIMQNLLLVESYFRKTGRPLFDQEVEITDVAQLLWEAPFALLSHDGSDDPKVRTASASASADADADA